MVDWTKIKTEYITTDTSYRKLAQKYGIHYKVISDRGKAEEWVDLRSQHRDKTLTKTLDRICDKKVDRAARLQSVAEKLLNRVEKMIDDEAEILSTQSIKNLSGVLKDIKDIQMIKSDADMKEQEARIAHLQKQAEKEDKNKSITITLEGGLKDYAQ